MQLTSFRQEDLKQALQALISGKKSVPIQDPPPPLPPPPEPQKVVQEVMQEVRQEVSQEVRQEVLPPIEVPLVIEKRLSELQEQLLNLEQTKAHEGDKQRLLRLVTEKRELEEKCAHLSNEKAALIAKLRDLQAQQSAKDADSTTSSKKLHELSWTCEHQSRLLEERQKQLDETLAQNRQANSFIGELQASLLETSSLCGSTQEKLRALTDELEGAKKSFREQQSVSQACIVDKQQRLEELERRYRELVQDHDAIKTRFQELEQHAKQLELHLARRVKECALLSKEIESQKTYRSELEKTLEAKKLQIEESAVREEKLTHDIATRQKEEQTLQQKLEALEGIQQEQDQELDRLRKAEERLLQLEQLFGQCGQLLIQPLWKKSSLE